ncbi:MAG TPA: glycoside hydrolase family 2 TIM barrel-domain containing protein [Thermoleophilaceae bacterium]|nr:glycoside hydrolase family 2 TIM barrel-domain containing protein [Thermoleophilaceae bacterium]
MRHLFPTVLALVAAYAGSATGAASVPAEHTLYADAPNGMFLLDRGWTTRADPHDAGLRRGWWHSGATAGFRPTSVPNAFNARNLSRRSFAGGVQWYRASFTAPQVDGVAQWRTRFESVNVDATVWLNGKRIGHHRGAYLPFELVASSLRNGANELVVRVDSRGNATDLPPANRPRGWWNFGGILREVYLRAVRSFDLSDLHVVPAPGAPATVHVTGTVRNMSVATLPAPVTVHLRGRGIDTTSVVDLGAVGPRERKQIDTTATIPSPELWSPSSPTLYELTVTLPGGQTTTSHFGIRRWSVGRDGRLLLNGAPLTLRGASFHEQTPANGAAMTPANRAEIVRELQAIGANATRTHYPPHPALLEAFDRAGIVFWEQIPVWRVRERQLRNKRFRSNALAALRQAIVRDRNHASVLAWSVSNETLRGGAGERAYLRAARTVVNQLDRTRLLAADKSLQPLNDLPSWYRSLDAIGLNEYVGWYGGKTSELRGDLAEIHRRFPHQALVVTEFGAEANRSGPASRKGTYAFQQRFLANHLNVFDKTPFLSGALVWVLRDFAARPGWTGGNPHPRPPILFKGLFNQNGSPKPAAATVKQSFGRAPAARG